MGQSAVTNERLEAVTRLLAEAARRGELDQPSDREPSTPELTGDGKAYPSEPSAGGGGILQLVLTPETLLKLTGSGTKELVVSINER